MSGITTHVLDTSTGRPAAGIEVELELRHADKQWSLVGQGATDDDGRIRSLTAGTESIVPGIYRLVFHTGAYFARTETPTFYPHVIVVFRVAGDTVHYHVPLLLSPFGYSTYRGS